MWLKEGDRNTKFFHVRASLRRQRNEIKGLRDRNGIWCTSRVQLEDISVQYFQELFTSSFPAEADLLEVLQAVPRRVSQSMNQFLVQPFSRMEVEVVIQQFHPSKAPKPDGMSPIFYQ